jgi:hypothetical protein
MKFADRRAPWKVTSGTEKHVLQVMQFHKTGVYRELPSGVGIGHYNLGRSLRMVSIMFVLNSLFLF